MSGKLALGIDIGTSGVRVVALDAAGDEVAQGRSTMPAPDLVGTAITQAPEVWWTAIERALAELATRLDLSRVGAVAVDGTSGTVVAIDASGAPLAPARMYNDPCTPNLAAAIAANAPASSAARGASSALGRAMELQRLHPHRILHQADWIAGQFSGRFDISDENNALKTGYDPVARRWPGWIGQTGMDVALLPEVVAAGATTGACRGSRAREFGLAPNTLVVAGTTDGCAAFLATGANRAGDGVTSLGTTLVLKLLSDRPVFAPDYGIYSHRIGDVWLAGGASNSGGAALLSHFTAAEIEALQPRLRPQIDLGLGFYPLPGTGERFPINDPAMTSRISPRPADQTDFLQALLEGIADVEALGYRRLTEIGAPKLISLRSAGGGAGNRPWTEIRRRKLGVPFLPARSEAAAAGVARLALQAMESNAS